MAVTAADELDVTSRWIRTTAKVVFFGILPAACLVVALSVWFGSERAGFDLRHAYLPAADAVLSGDSPYPLPGDPEIGQQHAYVYTPLVAFVVAPLTLVSADTAVVIGTISCFLAAIAVLWLAGVRDWRCYGIAMIWPPVVNCAGNASVSLLLAALLAGAWRSRHHEIRSGALVGLTVAAKSFAWPMLLWPLMLKRMRGAATAAALAVVLSLGTWASIGFAGLGSYPDLLRELTDLEEDDSFSVSGTLLSFGASGIVARGAAVLVTVALVALAIRYGRRRDEQRTFVTLLLVSLAATPILWQHYLVFLLLAVAISQPRLSLAWLLPLVLYVAPMTGNGAVWQTILVPVVAAIVGVMCLRPTGREAGTLRTAPRAATY